MDETGHILLAIGSKCFLWSTTVPRKRFLGPFVSYCPAPCVDGVNTLRENMAEVSRCTIISLDHCLHDMTARADLTRPLTVRMKHSISGTCSFLDVHLSFIPRAVISVHIGYLNRLQMLNIVPQFFAF